MTCNCEVNNVPENASKYIVARVNDLGELWYWGSWNKIEDARLVAEDLEYGVLVNRGDD